MDLVKRLLNMFTIINLLFVCFYKHMTPFYKDIAKASTMLVLLTIGSVWFSGDIFKIYLDLYDSISPIPITSIYLKIAIMIIGDFIFHVVPVLVLGIPQKAQSIGIAYILLLLWYAKVRSKIGEIYSTIIKSDRAIVTTGLLGGIIMLFKS